MPVQQPNNPIEKVFSFDGAWMPDFDPSKMGEENFAELKNYRPVEDGIEPIEGYSAITSNPTNATYKFIRDGIQLKQVIGGNASFILVFAWNSGETAGRIYENQTAVPSAGDFETSPIFTPSSPENPRFAELPRGIAYCDENEDAVYEGNKAHPGVVVLVDSISGLSYTNARDFTNEITNSATDANNTMSIVATARTYIIGSTRPIQGFNVTIETANATAGSTLSVSEWTSGAWGAVSNLSDGTASGGITHAQTGDVTFDSTVSSAEPSFIDNVYLYHYKVTLSDGTAEISEITVDMPMQNTVDIWDGVFRECISFQVIRNGSAFEDYTLEVNEESNIDYAISAKLQNLGQGGGDEVEIFFEERASAIKLEILGTKGNTSVAATLTVYYWDGDSWVDVGTIVDGTLDDSGGTKTLNQSGVISWNPPSYASEKSQTKFGVTGYGYKLVSSAQLTDDVEVDFCTGVPAPRVLRAHRFPAKFTQRAFFGGDIGGGEGNSLDYTASQTIDVHNGADSSARGQRIYVGGNESLTAAKSVYNRFGSSIYETLLIFKNNETYLLTGTGPSDFRLFRVSENYGCPAPRTLSGAEIGYEMAGGAYRNVVMWLSYRGPVIFDGAVIQPIKGIDLYFDTRKSTVINTSKIGNSVGWFDPFWKEYHLLIPSGSSQTTLNTHLVYDLERKKWWEVDYGTASVPQFGMIVKDTDGAAYPYVGFNDGHIKRFGNGTDWDGTSITHSIKTADIIPAGFWHETQLNALKIGHQVPDFDKADEDITINITAYIDGAVDGTTLEAFTLKVDNFIVEDNLLTEASNKLLLEDGVTELIYDRINLRRYTRKVQGLDQIVHSVAFKFSRTSTSADYLSNFGKSLLWWGFRGKVSGQDQRGDKD